MDFTQEDWNHFFTSTVPEDQAWDPSWDSLFNMDALADFPATDTANQAPQETSINNSAVPPQEPQDLYINPAVLTQDSQDIHQNATLVEEAERAEHAVAPVQDDNDGTSSETAFDQNINQCENFSQFNADHSEHPEHFEESEHPEREVTPEIEDNSSEENQLHTAVIPSVETDVAPAEDSVPTLDNTIPTNENAVSNIGNAIATNEDVVSTNSLLNIHAESFVPATPQFQQYDNLGQPDYTLSGLLTKGLNIQQARAVFRNNPKYQMYGINDIDFDLGAQSNYNPLHIDSFSSSNNQFPLQNMLDFNNLNTGSAALSNDLSFGTPLGFPAQNAPKNPLTGYQSQHNSFQNYNNVGVQNFGATTQSGFPAASPLQNFDYLPQQGFMNAAGNVPLAQQSAYTAPALQNSRRISQQPVMNAVAQNMNAPVQSTPINNRVQNAPAQNAVSPSKALNRKNANSQRLSPATKNHLTQSTPSTESYNIINGKDHAPSRPVTHPQKVTKPGNSGPTASRRRNSAANQPATPASGNGNKQKRLTKKEKLPVLPVNTQPIDYTPNPDDDYRPKSTHHFHPVPYNENLSKLQENPADHPANSTIPIYEPYGAIFDSMEAAHAYRKSVRSGPQAAEDLQDVQERGELFWVRRIYNAMIDISYLRDTAKSIHVKRFTERAAAVWHKEDLEAAAWHVLERAIKVHTVGWNRAEVYHMDIQRGKRVGSWSYLEQRLEAICAALRVSKACVDDALRGGLTLALLCDNPIARQGTKESNNVGNTKRGQRLGTAKENAAALAAVGIVPAGQAPPASAAASASDAASGSGSGSGSGSASAPDAPAAAADEAA